MRKKSHISLAKYLMVNMNVSDLTEHKKAFYIGSILPDLKPSFLTQKHNIEGTFGIVIEEIKKITIDYDVNQGITGYYARHLGIVTHYLADYCTFPHNSVFQGSIKDHCKYEKEMKFSLREYVERDDVQRERKKEPDSRSIDDIFQLIVKTHREYLKALNSITQDIHYIVDLCYKVVDAILQFFELAYASLHNNYREQKSMI